MITSLKFLKTVKVNVGNTGKFKVFDNENIFTLKDIPAVRYKFETYEDSDIAFIKEMHSKFKHSVHVVEFDVMVHDVPALYQKLHEAVENVAVIAHIGLNDAHAETRVFTEEEQQKLQELRTVPINRLMLHDRSDKLDYQALSILKDAVLKLAKISDKSLGYCGSPYTDSTNSCLNAAMCREWSAKYNKEGEGSLPSANHNSTTESCGCLRYIIIDSDIEAVNTERGKKSDAGFMNLPADLVGESDTSTKKAKSEKAKGEKAPKEAKPKKLGKNVALLW